MEEGSFIIPYQIRNHAQNIIDWLAEEDTQKALGQLNVDELKEKLSPLTKYHPEPKRNPYVLIRYEYDGYYGSFKEKYVVTLLDYVAVALTNPTFCYHDKVGKHSEVTATVDQFSVEFVINPVDYYISEYDYWNMNGDYGPQYPEEAKEELLRVFEEESPAYDVQQDEVPDPKEFIPLIERVLEKYPMETTLTWERSIDTGEKTWKGKPDLLHISIEFSDAREAALFVARAPKIEYYTWRNKEKRYPVDMSTVKAECQTFFEDDSVGTDSHNLWVPDPHQLDQLKQECAPRASWDEMLRAAKSVLKQKRLKF